MCRVEFDAENRSRHVEFSARQTCDDVAYRQFELFDRKVRSAIQKHKRAASLYKFAEMPDAFRSKSAGVLRRHRAFLVTLQQRTRRLIRNQNYVVLNSHTR